MSVRTNDNHIRASRRSHSLACKRIFLWMQAMYPHICTNAYKTTFTYIVRAHARTPPNTQTETRLRLATPKRALRKVCPGDLDRPLLGHAARRGARGRRAMLPRAECPVERFAESSSRHHTPGHHARDRATLSLGRKPVAHSCGSRLAGRFAAIELKYDLRLASHSSVRRGTMPRKQQPPAGSMFLSEHSHYAH